MRSRFPCVFPLLFTLTSALELPVAQTVACSVPFELTVTPICDHTRQMLILEKNKSLGVRDT
jgi:hypothetical protein